MHAMQVKPTLLFKMRDGKRRVCVWFAAP